MAEESHYSDSVVVPASQWTRDGHRFVARFKHHEGVRGRSHTWLHVEVECPGLDRCKDPIMDCHGLRPVRCNIQEWVSCSGWDDFAESMADRESIPVGYTAELPLEIEWRYSGYGEDADLQWRPVARSPQGRTGGDG